MRANNKADQRVDQTERFRLKEAEAAGRRAVVILFLITVILSIFFWLKKEFPPFWQKMTTPYKIIIEKGDEK